MKPLSPILSAVSKYVFILVNILALYIFFKGHNEPGGGFIAGVASAISFILLGLTLGFKQAKEIIGIDPIKLAVMGVSVAYATAVSPIFFGYPFLYHKMIHLHVPILGDYHIGTPFLFDLGVYLAVVGVIVKMIFVFSDAQTEKTS